MTGSGPAGWRTKATTVAVGLLCVAAFQASSANAWLIVAQASAAAILLRCRVPRPRLPDVLAVAIAAWAQLTVVWSSDVGQTRSVALAYTSACLLFVAVRHVAATPRHLLAVGGSYIVGCAIAAWRLIIEARGAGGQASAMDMAVRFGIEGTNINFTAYSSVTAFVLALGLLKIRGQSRLVTVALTAALPVLACGVFLNRTKGALVALLLVVVYALLSELNPRAMWVAAAAVVPTLLVTVPLGLGQSALGWADGVIGSAATGDVLSRIEMWRYATSYWWDDLWFGGGAGIFEIGNPLGIRPHNAVLAVAVDLGLVGLLGVVALFGSVLATRAAQCPVGLRVAGLFLVGGFPIWLTGVWEFERGPWLALALLSVLPVQVAERRMRRFGRAGHLPAGPNWSPGI
ncbi:O-antigen ligase family protein [Micromonospora lupini]|uniref:O-antigen ligase family protein n=1 Tax=Micromonospora lupini TaxID=285679 RepID=UPI0022518F2D|nr:O-antigen ligase family protein [Micromonospora lupini]MCX5070034.1 O-antigen ligase family protein [Micromonospora lupini]